MEEIIRPSITPTPVSILSGPEPDAWMDEWGELFGADNKPHVNPQPLYLHPPQPLSLAACDMLAERRRQIEVEGWDPELDDRYTDNQLARAAACYAAGVTAYWPWDMSWWKPSDHDRRRDLIKAGALIVAEIERLDRAAISTTATEGV